MQRSPLHIDPQLSLRWLHRARRGMLLLQTLLMVLAEIGTGLHLHSPALVLLLLGLAAIDLLQARLPPSERLVRAHALLDLCALTAMVALSGGPSNPLTSAYLVYLALLAILLPPSQVWAAVGLAVGLQIVSVLHPGERMGLPHEDLPLGHLIGHVVAFDLAAIAIVWFVSRVSATLHERESTEREILRQSAATERLAALGRLAAGVAHEMGTPLGTIQLASEQLAEQHPSDDIAQILEQVERCRAILERLRGREDQGQTSCAADLETWASEWARSAPEVTLSVQAYPRLYVAGAEESWRAAVWTALDNARKAGAKQVSLSLLDRGDLVEIAIRDDGVGIDADTAAHAGEPFRTGWGGTGLGLFVARSFAQSVGGDITLEPCEKGTMVRISLAKVTS